MQYYNYGCFVFVFTGQRMIVDSAAYLLLNKSIVADIKKLLAIIIFTFYLVNFTRNAINNFGETANDYLVR